MLKTLKFILPNQVPSSLKAVLDPKVPWPFARPSALPADVRAASALAKTPDVAAEYAPVPAAPPPQVSNTKLAGMVTAEAAIKETGLEGGSPRAAAQHMSKVLRSLGTGRWTDLRACQDHVTRMAEHFERMAQFASPSLRDSSYDYAHEIGQQIGQLEAGECLLVPGGWSSGYDSNHTMVYRVEREVGSPQRYTLTVYNAGSGAEYHDSILEADGSKQKYQGIVRYAHVPAETFFTGVEPSQWLQALCEPSVVHLRHGQSYGSGDIYETLLPQCGGVKEMLSDSLAHFFTAQRSGSCSWSALMAVMADMIPDDHYKRVKLEVEGTTLLGFHAHASAHENPSPESFYVLRKASQNLKGAAVKLAERGELSAAERARVLEGLLPIDAFVARMDALTPKPFVAHWPQATDTSVVFPRPLSKLLRNPIEGEPGYMHVARPSAVARKVMALPPRTNVFIGLPDAPGDDTRPMAQRLTSWSKYARDCIDANAPHTALPFLDEAIGSLPLPTRADETCPAWDDLDALPALDALTQLFDTYFTVAAISQEDFRDGPQALNILTLAACIDRVARRALDAPRVQYGWSTLLRDAYSSPADPLPVARLDRYKALHAVFDDLEETAASLTIPDQWTWEYDMLLRALDEKPDAGDRHVDADLLATRLAPLVRDLGYDGMLPGNMRALGLLRRTYFMTALFANPPPGGLAYFLPSQGLVRPQLVSDPRLGARAKDTKFMLTLDGRSQPVAQIRKTPAPGLSQVARMHFASSVMMENDALVTMANEVGETTPVSLVHRLSVLGTHPVLRMPMALNYFQMHLEALKTSEGRAEFQACLRTKATSPTESLPPIFVLPPLMEQLALLLTRGFDHFGHMERDLGALLFVCRTIAEVKEAGRSLGIDVTLPNARPFLYELTRRDTLSGGERCAVWRTLVATADAADALQNDASLQTMMECIVQSRLFAIPQDLKDVDTNDRANANMLVVRNRIAERLENPDFCTDMLDWAKYVVRALQIPVDPKQQWEVGFPFLFFVELEMDVTTGEITVDDAPFAVGLPAYIQGLEAYRALVGSNAPQAHFENGVYHIGETVRVEMGLNAIFTKRLSLPDGDAWFMHRDPYMFAALPTSVLSNHLLFQKAPGDGPEVVITDAQTTPLYEGIISNDGMTLRALGGENQGATLVPPKNLPEALAAFEDSAHVLLWQRDGANLRLELPRYGLTFTFDPQQRARSADGRFWLSLERPAGFRRYVGALMFESDDGTRKLALPMSGLAKSGMFPSHDADMRIAVANGAQLRYNMVDFDGHGAHTSTDPATCIQLAYVHAAEDNFAEAVKHMRQARAYAPWPPDAWGAVRRLLRTPTSLQMGDPDALALLAMTAVGIAASLQGGALDKTIATHGQDAASWGRTLVDGYLRYLGTLGNVDVTLRLSPYEESQALSFLLRAGGDMSGLLFARMRYLNGQNPAARRIPGSIWCGGDLGWTQAQTQKGFTEALRSQSRASIERLPILHPGPQLLQAFAHALEIIDTGSTEEKHRLEQRLRIMSAEESPTNRVLRRCLLAALDDPNLGVQWLRPPPPGNSLREDAQALSQKFDDAKAILARAKSYAPVADYTAYIGQSTLMSSASAAPPVSVITHQVAAGVRQIAPSRPLELLAWAVRETAPKPLDNTVLSVWPQAQGGVIGEQASAVVSNIKAFNAARASARTIALDAVPRLRAEVQGLLNRTALDTEKSELERMANEVAKNRGDPNLLRLQVESKRVARISMGDLQTAFARRDLASLRKKNPWLSDMDIHTMGKRLRAWLVETSRQQQLGRIVACLDRLDAAAAVPSDAARVEYLLRDLAALISAPRAYDVGAQPELLVFECSSDMLLRPSQVSTIARLQAVDSAGRFRQLVQQLNMGEGKTKILLPLLALKKADGKCLPMVIVPQELFDVNHQDLSATSQMHFGQACQPFMFDRNSSCDLESLQFIREMFRNAKAQRQYILTTREAIQSFRHQYVTFLAQLKRGVAQPRELSVQIAITEDILRMWRQEGHAHIDEADQVLEIKKELNYSHGSPEAVDAEAADLVADIMVRLATDPTLAPRVRLREDKQALLSKEDYADIAAKLAVDLIESHPRLLALQAVASRDELISYVTSASGAPPVTVRDLSQERWGESLNLLALLKEELTCVLPLTLSRSNLEDYGPAQDHDTPPELARPGPAVPYHKTKPMAESRFGVVETLNYTLQDLLQRPRRIGEIHAFLEKVREGVLSEMRQNSIPMIETQSYGQFAQLVAGTPLEDVSLGDLRDPKDARLVDLSTLLHGDPTRLLLYARAMVYPTIEQYTQQLSSNAHDFVDSFACVQGFSGTVWNALTFAPRLETVTQPETDGSTAEAFFDPRTTSVHSVRDMNMTTLLSDENGAPILRAHALIDAGALLKDYTNPEVARLLATHFSAHPEAGIRGILYFDGSTNQLAVRDVQGGVTQRLDGTDAKAVRAAGFDPSTLFAYYDQAHTTGTDLPLPDDAAGVLTISKSLRLRDVQQSALRLRRLASGQRLVVKVPSEVSEAMRWRSVNMDNVCNLALTNQANQLGDDKVRALKLGMQNVAHALAFDMCLTASLDVKALYFAALEPLLVDNLSSSFYQQFGGAEETATDRVLQIFETHLAQRLEICAASLAASGAPASSQLRQLAVDVSQGTLRARLSTNMGALPQRSRHGGAERTDTEQQVQKQALAEVDQERSTQTHRAILRGARPASETPLDVDGLYDLEKPWGSHAQRFRYGGSNAFQSVNAVLGADVFDDHVWCTENFARTADSGRFALLTAHGKPVHFFIGVEEPNGVQRFMALSAAEAEAVMTLLDSAPAGPVRAVSLFNAQGQLVKKGNPACAPAIMQSEAFERAVVQFKVLTRTHTGELHLTGAQRRAMDAWLNSGTKAQQQIRRRLLNLPEATRVAPPR